MVIDTNIFIEHLRAKNKTSTKLYQLSENSELFISAISLYELYMGANTPAKEQDIKALTEDITFYHLLIKWQLSPLRFINC